MGQAPPGGRGRRQRGGRERAKRGGYYSSAGIKGGYWGNRDGAVLIGLDFGVWQAKESLCTKHDMNGG